MKKRFNVKLFFPILILAIICVFSGISMAQEANQVSDAALQQSYDAAISDAKTVDPGEVFKGLTVIDSTNKNLLWKTIDGEKYVLTVTWTNYPDSYKPGQQTQLAWGDIWVTVVPELKNFVKTNNIPAEGRSLRLEQLLGLRPHSNYKGFAELWVRPADVFRPTPDPSITITAAPLEFPANTTREHKVWFTYYKKLTENTYPWTKLGYTYDWGNSTNHVGLSEFVVKWDSKVWVNSVFTTDKYFDQ